MAATSTTHSASRVLALDALRGMAILGMILSGNIPGSLPAWMFHAQVPPPERIFQPDIPGITWVDWVFPFFLFAMGAAFPLALSRRLARGDSEWKLLVQTIKRFLLLAGFAIYLQHIKPWSLQASPDTGSWLIALAGFALLFPLLMRFPRHWPWRKVMVIRLVGLLAAIALLSQLTYPDGSGFSLYRSDIIILVLANVALTGSIIWLFTRHNWLLRMGILGLLLAFRLSQGAEGSWVDAVWSASPFPWLYQFAYMQYLFIVLPGTIVGDSILHNMNQRQNKHLSALRTWLSALFLIGWVVFTTQALFMRWLTTNLVVSAFVLPLVGWLLFFRKNILPPIHRRLFLWAVFWLILGLVLEPYEGGIKKDHATLSYYFVTTGLAIFTLQAFMLLVARYQGRGLGLLIRSGQNPMVAYLGASNLVIPVLALSGIHQWLQPVVAQPLTGFIYGLVITLAVAWVAAWLAQRKIYWRS